MLDRLFCAHPREVGESYLEHLAVALSFSARLFAAAAACLLHALVPALCVRTGSNAVRSLHERMVASRGRAPAEAQLARR